MTQRQGDAESQDALAEWKELTKAALLPSAGMSRELYERQAAWLWHRREILIEIVEASSEPLRLLEAMIQATDWPTFSSPAMRSRIVLAATALRNAQKRLQEVS